MIYSRLSVFFALSIAYLGFFTTATFAAVNNTNTDVAQKDKESSKVLLLLAMGATSVVAGTTLFFLLQPEANRDETKLTEKSSPQAQTKIYSGETSISSSSPENNSLLPQSVLKVPLSKNWALAESHTEAFFLPGLTTEYTTTAANSLALNFNHTLITDRSTEYLDIFPTTINSVDSVFKLIQDLQQSNVYLRRQAIWELAQKSDSRAIAPLIEVMSQASSLEKSLIIQAIAQITSRSLKPMHRVLLNALEDSSPQVRKNAIRDSTLLCQLTSQVTRRLSQLVEDSDLEVRQTAQWALQQLNPALGTSKIPMMPELVNNQDNLAK